MFGRHSDFTGRVVAAALAALAGSVLGTGPAAAQDKGEIAVMLPAAGDPYFKLKSFGYVDEGEKLGYDVTIYDAGGYGNLSRQVSQIEDVIQRSVDAIVLVPASSDGTVPVVEKAVDNGIPVINDGIATNTPKVTGFVGEDSYVMGEMLGVHIAEALGGKGNVAMLSGPAGLDLTNSRVGGFKDYIALFPEIQVVAEKFTSTSSAEIQAHPAGDPELRI
jgi:ABC-type sugar transport system substrate-binding protein